MAQIWTNPIGLCLFLHLLAGAVQSQIQFKTKFNSAPIIEPKKISSSTPSFVDQASQFRSVLFQKRKPQLSLFKSAKFPFGAEASTTATEEVPSSVTEREKEVSDVLLDETSTEPEATTRVHDDDEEEKSSNVFSPESTTELFLDGSTKTPDVQGTSSVVKASTRFLNDNLFQRPRSSLLASSRGKNRKVSTFLRSGDHARSDLPKLAFPVKESKIVVSPTTASSFRSSESPNRSLAVPSSSVVENTRLTVGLTKQDPFLDKVNHTRDVKFSNDEVTTTEGSPNVSFNATDLSRSSTEVKVKPLKENLFQPRKSSLLAFSRGKTVTVTTTSALRRSSKTPSRTTSSRASPSTTSPSRTSPSRTSSSRTSPSRTSTSRSTPVQGVSNSVEEEDIIVEMMRDVLLDTLKQDVGNAEHFNRDSLISRLRPLVVELLSSSDASSLTLKEKVERLREALMEESPEIIRSHFESSKFDLHAKNLFLQLRHITRKEPESSTKSQVEENLEELKREDVTSERTMSDSDVTKRNKLRERLSFSNLERWKSNLEITSTQRSLVEKAAMTERLNLRNLRPPVSIDTSGLTGSRTSIDIQKIRRVVFSALTYPSLPLKELGKFVPEDGRSSVVKLLNRK